MSESPVERLFGALDRLDVRAAMDLMAPDCKLLTVDGRRAEGTIAVRALLTDFLATLHSTTHRITGQWHQDDVWIAEVEASYELMDRLRITALPRAFVVRHGPDGVTDLRVYGAHEQPLAEHPTSDEELRIDGRWIPPL